MIVLDEACNGTLILDSLEESKVWFDVKMFDGNELQDSNKHVYVEIVTIISYYLFICLKIFWLYNEKNIYFPSCKSLVFKNGIRIQIQFKKQKYI